MRNQFLPTSCLPFSVVPTIPCIENAYLADPSISEERFLTYNRHFSGLQPRKLYLYALGGSFYAVAEAKISTTRLDVAANLKASPHGVHWRAFTAVLSQSAFLVTRADPMRFTESRSASQLSLHDGWQGKSRVPVGLRDLSIPVPTLQSINLTDGECTYIVCLPVAFSHLDTI